MNYTTEIDLAREAIIQGETPRALTLLLNFIKNLEEIDDKKYYNEICIQSNKLNQIKQDRRLDIIPHNTFTLELNKINRSLIETITSLELYVNSSGIKMKKFNTNNSFSMPRNSVPTNLYSGFLIACCLAGAIYTAAFMVLLYRYILKEVPKIEELLFIIALGVFAQMFFISAFDGINKRKDSIVDWRIIMPHIIIATSLCIISGILNLI